MNSKYIKALWPLLLLLLPSCQSEQIYMNVPLVSQTLKPRTGHDGKLTHSHCVKYSGDVCENNEITDYDLNDSNFRTQANQLGFVCVIGIHRYKICLDKAGFCHLNYPVCPTPDCNGIKPIEEFIPAVPVQFLIDADLRCYVDKSDGL